MSRESRLQTRGSMASPLLRSSALAAIHRELEEDTASDLFNVVVISPCQTFVSNDPEDVADNVVRTPCNITSFVCFDTTEVDTSSGNSAPTTPSEVTVDFDYELWYTNADKFNTTVSQLESSMLQHLAKVFNLLECPYVSMSNTATSASKQLGGQRRVQIFGDELADLFVGVDSTPVDEPDNEIGTYLLVSYFYFDGCFQVLSFYLTLHAFISTFYRIMHCSRLGLRHGTGNLSTNEGSFLCICQR